MDAADRGAGIGIGRGGDSAGIEHNQRSFIDRCGRQQAALGEAALNGSAIGLRGPTPEILHKELRRHYVNYKEVQAFSEWVRPLEREREVAITKA
jgi:hypothetical protein